jgi:16S rRNA (guanine527-N7)-methyltransferase
MSNSTEILPPATELWRSSLDWQPSVEIQDRFQQLYDQVISANHYLNLTRITQVDEFWEKHLWDSLRGIKDLINSEEKYRAIDIGTGGGFPGLPIALARPDWQVDLVDSTAKKINFVRTLCEELNITNTQAFALRIEAIGRDLKYRESYQLATVRAVAAANVCAEYALPLLTIGGSAILYRGNWTEEEATTLDRAADLLGGKVTKIDRFHTPHSESLRHCIWITKIAATPAEFPRDIGIPSHKPLGMPN